MLLWKSWRDLRPFVFAALIWFALLVSAALYHAPRRHAHPASIQASFSIVVGAIGAFVYLQTAFLAFVALGMGTRGVGRDTGENGGSFALTRPVRRAAYLWTEWSSGLAALGALLFFAAFVLFALPVRLGIAPIIFSRSGVGGELAATYIPWGTAALITLCGFLFLALIFCITHFGTVVLRHSTRGLLFCLGSLAAWFIGTAVLAHYYPAVAPHIPSLMLKPFLDFPGDLRLIPHLTASILERLAILPLFPLIAQLFLHRAEV